MKRFNGKKLIAFLIVGGLFLLPDDWTAKTSVALADSATLTDAVNLSTPVAQKTVIYQCRLGNEEIPAVQISEIKIADGTVTGTAARVDADSGIEITAQGAAPAWDYKSVAARAGDSTIEVAFNPRGARRGFDWILTLKDKNNNFRKRVRDCMEVSDE
ncbi:MAG TPA: hypothetical protein VGC97_09895 [Pyrinomonadaceae bacterium]|jgi:hypothetical protein